MQKPKRVLLLYGSVTGKAQSIAELIAEEGEKRGLEIDLQCMEGFAKKYDLYKESVVVMVSSTTGDGDQPENAEPFWRKIKRKTVAPDAFASLNIAMLGLGDSNYSQFCNGPKTLYDRLTQLGAKSFYDPGWADDGVGLELVVEPWIEGLWEKLDEILTKVGDSGPTLKANPITSTPAVENSPEQDNKKTLAMPSTKILSAEAVDELTKRLSGVALGASGDAPVHPLRALVKEGAKESDLSLPAAPANFLQIGFVEEPSTNSGCFDNCAAKFPMADSEAVSVPFVSGKRIVAEGAQKKCLAVTLNLKDSGLSGCEPGDALGFISPNPSSEVTALLDRLGLSPEEADRPISISVMAGSTKKNAKVPEFLPATGASLKQLFTNYLDFRAVVKKPLLRVLADSCSADSDKLPLLNLCSKTGGSDYLKSVRAPSLGLLDLLLTFPSCFPSCDRLLEQLPRLLPRPMSLASEVDPETGHADFVFNVVEIPLGGGRAYPRKGVCTVWLEDLVNSSEKDAQIKVYSRSNKSFRHPDALEQNVIMIGPGTGVAPFRGFLQQRARKIKNNPDAKEVGETWLFFGCRKVGVDDIFKTEIEQFVQDKVLGRYFISYSQENPEEEIKYVQHNVAKHWEAFSELLLRDNTTLFVCGDAANMAKDVSEAVIGCLEKTGLASAEARGKVAEMMVGKKYLQDVWT